MRTTAALAVLLLPISSAHSRESVCLNGEWDFLPLTEPRLGDPPSGDWPEAKINVPSWWTAAEFDYPPEFRRAQAGWYHRTFSLPGEWAGKRLWLRFGAVYYRAEAYVNGTLVGTHDGGFSPFTLDITGAAHAGENELLVGVVGWRAALKTQMRDIEAASTRDVPGGLIGPVGFYGEPGIWQDVFLEATGHVRIENVWVRTELEPRPRAIATVTSYNAGDETVHVAVQGAVRPLPPGARYTHSPSEVPKWPCESTGLKLQPGERRSVDLVQLDDPYMPRGGPPDELRLWWPGKPALYQFKVLLTGADGRPVDETVTRFGYREITWKGPSLFINGVPIHLRGEGRCGWSSHHLMPEHGEAFPKQVAGIPVGRKASALHFLVSSAWSQDAKDGDAIAEITVHYEDNSLEALPIRYGIDVIDWFYQPRRLANGVPAWIGANDVKDPIAVYRFAWRNPQPDVPIRSLDVRSLGVTIPILIAVTGDANAPSPEAEVAWESLAEPLELSLGEIDLTVTPTGALRIKSGGEVMFGDVALRLHNNERGGWAMLGSQWPPNECTMAAEHRRTADVTEIRAEGQLAFLDVIQNATIGPDGSVMLDYDCVVARKPKAPELVMGLLLNLTMPEVWADGKGTHDDGAEVTIARDFSPTTGLGAGSGVIRWHPAEKSLPPVDVGTSGRFNFFDARRWSGGETPSYVLQLMHEGTPTTVGERFTFRAMVMPAD